MVVQQKKENPIQKTVFLFKPPSTHQNLRCVSNGIWNLKKVNLDFWERPFSVEKKERCSVEVSYYLSYCAQNGKERFHLFGHSIVRVANK